jgi:prepilin peptidase CpaA
MGGIIVSHVNEGKGTSVSPAQAWLGMLAGFALPFAMFVMGAIRGGDVKLLAGIGAWIGPVPAFEVFIVEAVVGLVIVLVQCAMQGKLLALFRNSTVLAINLVNVSYLGVKHVSETGQQFRSIDRPLPYAVPVLIAVVLVVFGGM